MFFHSPFFVVALCCTLRQCTAPKVSKTYEDLLKEIKDKDEHMLSMYKDHFIKECSSEHRYNQRFFENAYMNQNFIDEHTGYRKLRSNFIENKFSQYINRDPKIKKFNNVPYSTLSTDQKNQVKVEFLKNKRLTQVEKWPVFLDWLTECSEEWKNNDIIKERLMHFYNEYTVAKRAGLTSDVFTECIINAWQRSSEIVKLPSDYDMANIFDSFLRVTNPWYVATMCGTLLKRAVALSPISRVSAEKYLKRDWVDEDALMLDIPKHHLQKYGSPPSPGTPDWKSPKDFGVKTTKPVPEPKKVKRF